MQLQVALYILLLSFAWIVACRTTVAEGPSSSSSTTTTNSVDPTNSTSDGSTTTTRTNDENDTDHNDPVDADNNIGTTKDFDIFLMACSQGDMDKVQEYVQNKDTQYYTTAYSKNGGESCLHVAGILGQAKVTQYILQNGGNPNQRSQNIPHGLRMTPLSWNVYGNHIDNVRLLLQAGADVNLDFDYIIDGTLQKVTVLDLLFYIHSTIDFIHATNEQKEEDATEDEAVHPNTKAARAMYDLLTQYGAQRYADWIRNDPMDDDARSSNQKLEL